MSSDHNQSLSQSDFRKLLQTPRVSAAGDSNTEDRSDDGHRRPGVLGKRRMQHRQQIVAKPTVLPSDSAKRKRTAGNRTHYSRTQQQQQQQKYRDRAAERRQQTTAEEPTHGIPETPSWTGGPMSVSSEERNPGTMSTEQRALYEQSKYLGGDLEHTHLVKGLDFLLLEKMRNRSVGGLPAVENAEDLDNELESLQQGNGKSSSGDISGVALNIDDVKATTQMGARVMGALQQMTLDKQRWKQRAAEDDAVDLANTSVTRNELFRPGHMYFELDLLTDGMARDSKPLVTVRLRSKEEIEQMFGNSSEAGDNEQEDVGDGHVVSRVISAISLAYKRKHDWGLIKENPLVYGATQQRQNTQSLDVVHEQSTKPSSPPKPQCNHILEKEDLEEEDEEDIFAEAGVDYEVTVVAPDASDSDSQETSTAPAMPPAPRLSEVEYDSDNDEMVVEPYPESPKEISDDDDAVVAPYT